jgi:predicted transcriptional regulator
MRRFLTSIRLDPEQMDALVKISQRERRTTAWLIREAVTEFIKRDSAKVRGTQSAAEKKR